MKIQVHLIELELQKNMELKIMDLIFLFVLMRSTKIIHVNNHEQS